MHIGKILTACCFAPAIAQSLAGAQGTTCASCHPKEVQQFGLTSMAHSLSAPRDQGSGAFVHRLSGTSFVVRSTPGAMTQKAERGGVQAEYPISYVIGSGNHAFAYVVRIRDFLFQSPISYYTKRAVWDMAPGFERDREPDFTRPVSAECLLCHSGKSFPASGMNRYTPPFVGEMAISCERCHGPTEAHLRHPSRTNIVNPARLPPRARDSVCEQCHLTGEARILNPGRTLGDFQAGQKLESTFSVYVFDEVVLGNRNEGLKVVSHAEQLRKSVCAQSSSGRLWCGTCHDPHNVPVDKKSFYRERCVSCHGQQRAANHPVPADDCVMCHMPSRPAKDGGHTAFTDHRIMKREEPGTEPRRERLVAWSDPDPTVAVRNLALAYLAVGEQQNSTGLLNKADELLTAAFPSFNRDPEILNGLGVVRLREGKRADSITFIKRALDAVPESAPYHVNLATALMENNDLDAAVQHLNRAIDIDPSLEVAYRRLVEVYGKRRNNAGVKQTFQRYLEFRPGSIGTQEALKRR